MPSRSASAASVSAIERVRSRVSMTQGPAIQSSGEPPPQRRPAISTGRISHAPCRYYGDRRNGVRRGGAWGVLYWLLVAGVGGRSEGTRERKRGVRATWVRFRSGELFSQ